MLFPVLHMANGQQFLQIRPFLAVQVLATANLSLSIFWTYFPAIVAAMFATLVTFQQFVHITQLWPDFTLLTISNNFGRILNFHPDFTIYNSLFWHSSINFDHISEYYFKKKTGRSKDTIDTEEDHQQHPSLVDNYLWRADLEILATFVKWMKQSRTKSSEICW